MTDRTEWPTPEKLERLRAEGVVSYSSGATACFVVSAVALVASAFTDEWGEAAVRYRESVVRGDFGAGWRICLVVVRDALTVLGAVVGIVVVLSGVGQTRFLFLPSRLTPRFDRLSPVRGVQLGGPLRAMVGSGLRLILGVVVGALFFGVFFRDMAGLLNHGLDYVVGHAREALGGALGRIALAAFGCGVVGWGCGWFAFRLRHRMTRAEVLADRAES